jgi:hypothetical protein
MGKCDKKYYQMAITSVPITKKWIFEMQIHTSAILPKPSMAKRPVYMYTDIFYPFSPKNLITAIHTCRKENTLCFKKTANLFAEKLANIAEKIS